MSRFTCKEDIIVDYVNQLRENLRETQERLKEMNDSGYKTIKGVEEGYKNLIADLQAEIEKLRMICKKQEEDRKAIDTENLAWRSEVIRLRDENAKLKNLQEDVRPIHPKHIADLEERLRHAEGVGFMTAADGDKAIQDGVAARARHIEGTREPGRGED